MKVSASLAPLHGTQYDVPIIFIMMHHSTLHWRIKGSLT